VGGRPAGIAYSPEDNHLYVGNFASKELSVISTVDNRLIGKYPVGSSPIDVIYENTTGGIYVTNFGSRSVSVMNTDNMTETTTNVPTYEHCTIPVDEAPFGIIYFNHPGSKNDGHIYVTNPNGGTVTMIDAMIDAKCSPRDDNSITTIVAAILIIVVVAVIVYLVRSGWANVVRRSLIRSLSQKEQLRGKW
jgi:YVTN family beta-propeller protein